MMSVVSSSIAINIIFQSLSYYCIELNKLSETLNHLRNVFFPFFLSFLLCYLSDTISLFLSVLNVYHSGFDPIRTSEETIMSTFSATAAVQRVLMRKNFCFIRFGR